MTEMSQRSNACPKCGADLPVEATAGLCPRCLMAGALAQTMPDTLPMTDRERPSPAELAPHFPHLDILEYLGRGGMGVVYKARQKSLNRLVALKLLAPERVGDERFAQRFAKEAQALAALNHPNIVTIYDFGQAGGFYYLLMEFVDGVNLRQAMQAAKFTPDQALAIVPPICAALQYAHEHGIVHRDIKPENLLLDKEGRVKIADFGIAKMLNAEASEVGVTESLQAGTPQYMAPEQKACRRTDHRADIYSLGVLLYELLTGELPGKPLEPPSKKVVVDVRLDEIVLRALDENPERRYQTIAEVKTLVETVSSATEAQRQGLTPSARRHRLFTQVGIAVLILFSIAATWAAINGIGWTDHSHNERKQQMNTNTSVAILASLLAVTGCVETAQNKADEKSPPATVLKEGITRQQVSPQVQVQVQAAVQSPDARAIAEVLRVGGKFWTSPNGSLPQRGESRMTPDPSQPLFRAFLDKTSVTDDSLRLFAGLSQLNGLYLDGTRITDAGLAHLKGLPKLENLYLQNTQISDAGLVYLKQMPSLQVLFLDGSKVTDVGLSQLQQFAQLERLGLADTIITDSGLKHLTGLSAITVLTLDRTKVTEAGVSDFQKNHPNCRVSSSFSRGSQGRSLPPGLGRPTDGQSAKRTELMERAKVEGDKNMAQFSKEELKEISSLYYYSNDKRKWGSPEVVESLKTLISKYPKSYRTGCGVLYLAMMASGEEQEKYLKLAIKDYSDCWFGDGSQVGALARHQLADYYQNTGKAAAALALIGELQKDYPDAIDHNGRPLVILKTPPKAPSQRIAIPEKQSWASIGDTKEEVLKKCGEPTWVTSSFPENAAMGITAAQYHGEPATRLYFYTNKEDKCILGNIFYFPKDQENTEDLKKRILEVNSDGKIWTLQPRKDNLKKYRRDGVDAFFSDEKKWHGVTLDAFDAYCRAGRKVVAEKKDAISDVNLTEQERKTVTLTKPYPTADKGAATDKISVQYAAIELGKQAGLAYKWDESFKNTDPICRKWVNPDIKNKPFRAAMQELLDPVGLTYEVRENAIVLKRK